MVFQDRDAVPVLATELVRWDQGRHSTTRTVKVAGRGSQHAIVNSSAKNSFG